MKVDFQILGCDNGDVTPSAVFQFENKRYLINCGEGTQRFCTEHKIRLSKVSSVFLTRLDWDVTGGLPGMILTLADIHVSDLNIVGPPFVSSLIHSYRYFVYRPKIKIKVKESRSFCPIPSPLSSSSASSSLLPSTSTTLFPPLHPLEGGVKKEEEEDDECVFKDENVTVFSFILNPDHPLNAIDFDDDNLLESDRYSESTVSFFPFLSSIREKTEKELRQFPLEFCAIPEVADHLSPPISPSPHIPTKDGDPDPDPDPDPESPDAFEIPEVRPFPRLISLPKDVRRHRESVCYAFHLPDIPGKFDRQRAFQLGLKAGPVFSKLVRGESVVLENGSTIRPKDVISPSKKGPIVLIIDCPSALHFEQLQQSSGFKRYFDCDSDQSVFRYRVHCIVHITPQCVIDGPSYQHFIRSFTNNKSLSSIEGFECHQIVINSDSHDPLPSFISQAINCSSLYHLDSDLFSLSQPLSRSSLPFRESSPTTAFPLFYQGKRLMHIPILPLAPNSTTITTPAAAAAAAATRLSSPWAELESSFLQKTAHRQQPQPQPQHSDHQFESSPHPQVLFTGTGAALPAKYRNVSGIWVAIDDSKKGFFIDCGEGTFGQLMRRFPSSPDLNLLLKNLQVVFISHLHADHHLGLLRLILSRQRVFLSRGERNSEEDPTSVTRSIFFDLNPQQIKEQIEKEDRLLVIGPPLLGFWLEEVSHLFPLHYRFLSCYSAFPQSSSSFEYELDIEEFIPVRVIHCRDSFGFSIRQTDGWKVVYSGDTRPCPSLVSAGEDADLLIHEATFDSDLKQDAIDKRHSTTEEAIRIGVEMRAKMIVLTHFSQRYPKIPVIDEKYNSIVGIAFDLMTLRFSNFETLTRLLPILKKLYDDLREEEQSRDWPENEEMSGNCSTKNTCTVPKKRKSPTPRPQQEGDKRRKEGKSVK